MLRIKRTTRFKREFKRIKANPRYAKIVDGLLKIVLESLCDDRSLPKPCRDHALSGNWHGFRECHLRPDLLLIYRQTSDGHVVEFSRIGSHAELFK